MHDIDADVAQMFRRADARKLQQMRAADRSRRQDDLARSLDVNGLVAAADEDSGAALSIEREALRERIGFDAQVAAAARRRQERACGGLPKALAAAVLRIRDAFLAGAVVVRIERNAGVLRGLDKTVGKRQHCAIMF